ncbi:MDR family MFS transporter [Sphingomonas nostoxanthinifaciens]|uniref:MDR family MFS transporter n=1 Tax=Sphingomonas nostoxanthinifaciens TaxID=2872652 RepID=UPI001CC1F9D2|nr:MDR family MFS transporter [Sphingomonas nostoxanthinifaciens]UAK24136.1 multidrug efflux MFS transporter [Sphingomonas nostoxanthinifaciens]
MLRLRRRGLAAINSEVRDGIVPAASDVSCIHDDTIERRGTARNYRTVALIIACALFMEQTDATVLTTALPTMAREFGVTAPSMSIALTIYLLALAIFIPVSGRLADRFGSRTVFLAAIGTFVAGSMLCGQAPTLWFIVAARFIQGLGGAMMIPIGRLVLLRSVDKADMLSATAWLIMPALLGPIVGPPLGGFIVTYLDWRWIFYINVPIGLLGFVLVLAFIDDVREVRATPPDLPGFLLSSVALGCLLFGFELGSRHGQGRLAVTLIAIGVAAGLGYLRYARGRANAILDLTLMQVPAFRLSVIAGSLTRITQGAQPFLLPLMFQLGFGLSAATSGTITIAGAIGSLVMKALALPILRRFGFRRSLVVCGLVATLAYALCGFFRPSWPMPMIFAVLVVAGFFMSFQFTAYNTIAYDGIGKERMSDATSFYATFQQLMLSLGICIGASSLNLAMQLSHHAHPRPADFTVAFLAVTAISLLASVWNLRFAPDAGAEMRGQPPRRSAPAALPSPADNPSLINL